MDVGHVAGAEKVGAKETDARPTRGCATFGKLGHGFSPCQLVELNP